MTVPPGHAPKFPGARGQVHRAKVYHHVARAQSAAGDGAVTEHSTHHLGDSYHCEAVMSLHMSCEQNTL